MVFMQKIKFERMSIEQLDKVIAIEKASFSTPWTKNAFNYELQFNDCAHYIVVNYKNISLAGYAGMWVILDEAHITNLAVHKEYRGCGLGMALMYEMIRRSILLGAERMTLEVRPSNCHALSLYKRLGFNEKGIRKKYYTDNQEDAIIMWKENF